MKSLFGARILLVETEYERAAFVKGWKRAANWPTSEGVTAWALALAAPRLLKIIERNREFFETLPLK
jgi:hypothetical protein